MFIHVNLIVVSLYLIALLIEQYTGWSVLLNVVGFVFLILLTPYNVTKLLNLEFKSGIEKYFSWLTIFFFLYAPLYFIAHRLFGLAINPTNIFFVNIVIFALAYVSLLWRKKELHAVVPKVNWKELCKKHSLLLVFLALFGLMHFVNFQFYGFIPEADGYTDMLHIERYLEGESIPVGRQSAFRSAMTVMASFMDANPYNIFSFWMIALQTTLILSIYLLIKKFDIKHKLLKVALLLGAISVPVLNMEIDMTRPQNLYIIAFPMFVYFLYQGLKKNELSYWLYGGLIAILGIPYHEFFVFILFTFILVGFYTLFNKFYLQTADKKNKLIYGLSLALFISLVYSFAQEFRVFNFILKFLGRQSTKIANTSEWTWWFLGNYTTDGAQMGWPGFLGAAQYYGYYLSPALLFLLLLLIFFIVRQRTAFLRDRIIFMLTPILVIFLFMSEILPRLNAPYLPERMWVLTSLVIIIMSVQVWKFIENLYSKKVLHLLLSIFICATIIGIGGSLYIAQAKPATTSPAEYEAALWLKNNTPSDALFITQGKNKQMIEYFAQRNMIRPGEDFFLSDQVIDFSPLSKTERQALENQLTAEKQQLLHDLNEVIENDFDNLNALAEILIVRQENIISIQSTLETLEPVTNHLYVLYSEDKFNTIYAQRKWWRDRNFYGANLNKFDEDYPLIYDQDGVYIWKIK